jgi:hypothetical protein
VSELAKSCEDCPTWGALIPSIIKEEATREGGLKFLAGVMTAARIYKKQLTANASRFDVRARFGVSPLQKN